MYYRDQPLCNGCGIDNTAVNNTNYLMVDFKGGVHGVTATPGELHYWQMSIDIAAHYQTGENIRGGLGGAVGYAKGGDKGSDVGAQFDNAAGAHMALEKPEVTGEFNRPTYNSAMGGEGESAPIKQPVFTVTSDGGCFA